MKRAHFALSLVFAVGVLVGGISTSLVWAQNKAPVTQTELQRVALESASGREGVMYMADFAPGGVVQHVAERTRARVAARPPVAAKRPDLVGGGRHRETLPARAGALKRRPPASPRGEARTRRRDARAR